MMMLEAKNPSNEKKTLDGEEIIGWTGHLGRVAIASEWGWVV